MPNKEKHPIAFVARYLINTELKHDILTSLVSVAALEVRKLHCYTRFTLEVRVFLINSVDV